MLRNKSRCQERLHHVTYRRPFQWLSTSLVVNVRVFKTELPSDGSSDDTMHNKLGDGINYTIITVSEPV